MVSSLRRHRKVHKHGAQSTAGYSDGDWSSCPADPQDSDTGDRGARKTKSDGESLDGETDYQAAYTQIMQDGNGKPESPPFLPQAKEHPVKLPRGSAAIDMNSIAQPKMTRWRQYILETDAERSQTYTTGSDFWTSRITRPRRDSMDSLSSSMNSSLHGTAIFDPEEQEPAFRDSNSRSSVGFSNSPRGLPPPPVEIEKKRSRSPVDFSNSPRGLPPPPVEIGKKHSFECDICGNTIRVDRRLEWQ